MEKVFEEQELKRVCIFQYNRNPVQTDQYDSVVERGTSCVLLEGAGDNRHFPFVDNRDPSLARHNSNRDFFTSAGFEEDFEHILLDAVEGWQALGRDFKHPFARAQSIEREPTAMICSDMDDFRIAAQLQMEIGLTAQSRQFPICLIFLLAGSSLLDKDSTIARGLGKSEHRCFSPDCGAADHSKIHFLAPATSNRDLDGSLRHSHSVKPDTCVVDLQVVYPR
jgi:hypothetical protein